MPSKPTDLEFTITRAADAHWNCILKSWLRAYEQTWRDKNQWWNKSVNKAQELLGTKYYASKHDEVTSYRERGADFYVATPPDDLDLIIGWACGEAPVVHFVYVKPPYRGQGVARALVGAILSPNAPVVAYTHRTLFSDEIQKTHQGEMRLVTMG